MTDVLAGYKLKYENAPRKKYKIIARKGKGDNMSEAKQAKTRKVYEKTRGEHVKDVIIAVLVTAIIAFVAGAMFQDRQHDVVDQAVQAVTPTVEASK